ncbi:hydrogenase formation protein HypD [Dissulfurispira thermophila]|uniref:Hydrogenase formation protein HypD n=2 Tax=root TaxID=1 RepID=A0A7G1H0P7_9BACT|nr:hydrogenase formation protein HypD [Dissulfurispira thermophila]BCB96370.1 hydrogenase formation protein HypD [Dissulfurispira thermophila]
MELIKNIYNKIGRPINIMEVCGTHTVAIFKHGIRSLLPEGLKLLSGPGCPVCVTSIEDIDKVIAISMLDDVILCTFGDMMRVPGGKKSLSEAKAEGADIRIVYSPLDCLSIARVNINKKVVFFSAGFETTTPSVAGTLFEAERQKIDNFYIYSVNKLVPPAIEILLQSDEINIDGFILPGHVSTIIGIHPYKFIAEKYKRSGVITGFKAEDIITGIVMLLRQIAEGRAAVEIQYKSVVTEIGNQKAMDFINEFFETCDSYWRGIGMLPNSGLKLREKYRHRDAEAVFNIDLSDGVAEPKGCQCGLVLRGIKIPSECPLFGKACTPEKPVGACMVSTEGSCAAYYKYNLLSKH